MAGVARTSWPVGIPVQPLARGGALTNPGRLPGPILEEWDWQLTGACRDADAALFFSAEGERGSRRESREAAAKAVCRRCPVRGKCAAHALAAGEAHGVWGGMSEVDRAQHRG
jgi:WhiB family redox-sensing transcriptional regulator